MVTPPSYDRALGGRAAVRLGDRSDHWIVELHGRVGRLQERRTIAGTERRVGRDVNAFRGAERDESGLLEERMQLHL